MPNIRTIYWNVENYGDPLAGRRGNYHAISRFIGRVVRDLDADILILMELKQNGIGNPLRRLHRALSTNMPNCNWYYDWIPGALDGAAVAPYSTAASVNFTGHARNEGYAVFWKHNIAKFTLQRADPIDRAALGMAPGWPASNQSSGVRSRQFAGGAFNNGVLMGGDLLVPFPAGGAPPPYALSAGTTAGGNIVSGGAVVLAGGVVSAGVINLAPGTIIPAGTIFGPQGLKLNNPFLGFNHFLVPGGYAMPAGETLTLPPAGVTLIPEHILNLVLLGRNEVGFNNFSNFNPAGANVWSLLGFCDGIGAFYGHPGLVRRPAYFTIKVNTGGGLANQLIPMTVYHTPLSAPGRLGMKRAAYCRSMYQAYDHGGGAYIDVNRAVIGGDFNKRLSPNSNFYRAYTDPFGLAGGVNGGAGCNHMGAHNIRANTAFPAGGLAAPIYPALPAIPTAANNPLNKSSIMLTQNHNGGPAVLSTNTDHFKRSAVDNIFYRGFNGVQAPLPAVGAIFDLLNPAGGNPGGVPATVLQRFQHLPVFGGAAGPVAPPGGINGVLNAASILADMIAGNFLAAGPAAGAGPFAGPGGANIFPARRKAEFLRKFVSDHLPVLFDMNI